MVYYYVISGIRLGFPHHRVLFAFTLPGALLARSVASDSARESPSQTRMDTLLTAYLAMHAALALLIDAQSVLPVPRL